MSIECVICCEHLQSSEAVYHTPCGHVFHRTCLDQWFKRSETCPECRQEVAEGKIGRIYLHYGSNDSNADLISSLQSEIAGLNHELLIKEIEIIESNSNNTKLSTLLKSKDSEVKKLDADIWIAREHHRLWKNHAQMQMAAHECTRNEVARLTKELDDLKNAQNLATESWNKVANIFRGVSDHETIIQMIADSQSELITCVNSRYELERTVAGLEQELETDSEGRMLSSEQFTRKRELEEDFARSEIEKIALQKRVRELEDRIGNPDENTESIDDQVSNARSGQPMRKKCKISRRPLDVIDLTKDPIQPLVDLTEDETVIS